MSHLTEEENIEQLGRELFALVEQYDCRKVVLDLAAVSYATSSVLGKMISLHRKLHRNEGRLVMCSVRDELRRVLQSSRLIDYFHVADDLESALATFA
jgi:anti-sigma B factor antagonist